MLTFLLAFQALICFVLVGLVLLQQGKGADVGAAFGGGSNTLFGASGAKGFIGKLTTGTAIVFMACSIMLAREYIRRDVGSGFREVDPLSGSKFGATAPEGGAGSAEAPAAPAAGAAPATEVPAQGGGSTTPVP